MVDVEIKGLVGRLNKFCTRGLEAAATKCVSRTNYEVTPEHMLYVMNEDPNADLQAIYNHFGLDVGMVQKALTAAIEDFRTGNASRPVFSPVLLDWFQSGWLTGSVDYGMAEIRSGVLLKKAGRQEVEYRPDFVAFEIPDEFVVGYGLDYRDAYRNLPYIATLDEADIANTLP